MATTLVRIQQRRKTASQWTSSNEVLLAAETGVETDTGRWKLGDGSTAWTGLPYQPSTAADTTTYLTVLVHNGTSYPPRPAGAPNGLVRYIGPTQPTTWQSSDEWINNA